MARQVLADEIWDKLQPLLPKPKGKHGKDDRMFLEAVCWIVRIGAPASKIGVVENGLQPL